MMANTRLPGKEDGKALANRVDRGCMEDLEDAAAPMGNCAFLQPQLIPSSCRTRQDRRLDVYRSIFGAIYHMTLSRLLQPPIVLAESSRPYNQSSLDSVL